MKSLDAYTCFFINSNINFDLAVLFSEASTPNFYIMLFIEEEQGNCATYTLSGSCATISLLRQQILLFLRLFLFLLLLLMHSISLIIIYIK